MASSNIKLFDENKGNMLSDTEFSISNQRLNGLQTGVASSLLQNKAMYQTSLVAYAIAQIMMQNGLNANDTDAVSAFVGNLSASIVQKVLDKATKQDIENGVKGKWIPSELFKSNNEELANIYLKLAGGTMLGNLFLNADPTEALQAATKKYVDSNFMNFESNYMKLAINTYFGTGTYGESNITTVTFPFPINFFVFPNVEDNHLRASTIVFMDQIPTSFTNMRVHLQTSGKEAAIYVKKSEDNKSLSWYNNDDVTSQLNVSSRKYYYLYGGCKNGAIPQDQLITQSGTFTVEKTGKYYIELYGGGGEAYLKRSTGGSSCQSYNEVQLTAGEVINVVIGAANGGTTTFGSYSVTGGGNASRYSAGTGSGNLGTDGIFSNTDTTQGLYEKNISNGMYGSEYGYGGYTDKATSAIVPGGGGAVYISYLHA